MAPGRGREGVKVLVLGAGGIVGQHMLMQEPERHDVVYVRRPAGHLPRPYVGLDLNGRVFEFLDEIKPDVIVNLAGENRVDVVESDPEAGYWVNLVVPMQLAAWCKDREAHLIQVSTQGVFDGTAPRYGPHSDPTPITEYGRQKAAAERAVVDIAPDRTTIARLTFVLGIRPFEGIGRANPLEEMFTKPVQVQVNDRWFSPLFATDAADILWQLTWEQPGGIVHVGTPVRTSRYEIATSIVHATHIHPDQAPKVTPVSHEFFEGIAPRPIDTTWEYGARHCFTLYEGLLEASIDLNRRNRMDIHQRAVELNAFFGTAGAQAQLERGFGELHAEVAADYRRFDPEDDDELIHWYRITEAYIWELSAYHLDPGFNYSGMCDGIATHLTNAKAQRVLCLGDGIGDLTLTLHRRGLQPVYHDLAGSRTAAFADYRLQLHAPDVGAILSEGWNPPEVSAESFDAVVALDFFEHLVNVEEWVGFVFGALRPGGLFLAQNAFGMGDDEHGGSMPMHLTRNNRFEYDWDPLLESMGFERDGDWRIKP